VALVSHPGGIGTERLAQNSEEGKGILITCFSGSGRRLEGLTAVSSSYARRWPVVGLPGGSVARARGKMMLWQFDEAPHPDGRAREASNWCGDGGQQVSKAAA
jgi:hypothetical protein